MKPKKTYTMLLMLAGLLLFMAQPAQAAFTSVSAQTAYDDLTLDQTAVMLDVRTVDEYYGCQPPWDGISCEDDVDSLRGTPKWVALTAADGGLLVPEDVTRLPFNVPFWIDQVPNPDTGVPSDATEVRTIIEELLAVGAIDFGTKIYLISRTGYRSYYMAQWMDTQTFYNAATERTASFDNLVNIDGDGLPDNDLGGMQEWKVADSNDPDVWVWNNWSDKQMPPQVFSHSPEDSYKEATFCVDNDGDGYSAGGGVSFKVTILEPTAGSNGAITAYADVTQVCVGIVKLDLQKLSYTTTDACDYSDTPGSVITRYDFSVPLENNGTLDLYYWSSGAENYHTTLGVLQMASPNALSVGLDTRSLTVAVDSDCGPVDCDDNNAAVNLDATEVCDGIDNNCDGTTDEGFDNDNDGYTSCNGDCDDNDPDINPGAIEVCDDGLDNNCDGTTDEGFDNDGDGYTTCSGLNYDCDDNKAAINPGATEVCDGIDNNCDGTTDEGFDNDNDGYTSCNGDCDDNNVAINPSSQEICGDGRDNDCDGTTDEDFDNDGDGYTSCGGDCDDNNDAVNPGATEVYDGVDNNCDGVLDPPGSSPTAPALVYPSDGQTGLGTTITFKWAPSTDSDGDKVTYDFLACEENRDFTDCNIEPVAYVESKGIYYAGTGFGLLMFAAALAGDRRKIMMLLAAVIMTSSMLFMSCGGGDNTGNGNNEGYETYTGTGFAAGTTYRWKVIAKDGSGRETASQVRTFTTQ